MNVSDVSLKKVNRADPRYPAQSAPPFTDVYLLTCTFEDGTQAESAFYVTELVGDMTQARVSEMLRLFAGAVTSFVPQPKAA